MTTEKSLVFSLGQFASIILALAYFSAIIVRSTVFGIVITLTFNFIRNFEDFCDLIEDQLTGKTIKKQALAEERNQMFVALKDELNSQKLLIKY